MISNKNHHDAIVVRAIGRLIFTTPVLAYAMYYEIFWLAIVFTLLFLVDASILLMQLASRVLAALSGDS